MIRKSGIRFSEKIMLHQRTGAPIDSVRNDWALMATKRGPHDLGRRSTYAVPSASPFPEPHAGEARGGAGKHSAAHLARRLGGAAGARLGCLCDGTHSLRPFRGAVFRAIGPL